MTFCSPDPVVPSFRWQQCRTSLGRPAADRLTFSISRILKQMIVFAPRTNALLPPCPCLGPVHHHHPHSLQIQFGESVAMLAAPLALHVL